MADYSFNWDNFTLDDFVNHCAKAENNLYDMDECIGCVRVGDLCFDLAVRDFGGEEPGIEFTLYVGGIDTGFNYSQIDEGYPYTDADGEFLHDAGIWMPYDEFTRFAESVFTRYIEHCPYTQSLNLIEKAKQPLHVW